MCEGFNRYLRYKGLILAQFQSNPLQWGRLYHREAVQSMPVGDCGSSHMLQTKRQKRGQNEGQVILQRPIPSNLLCQPEYQKIQCIITSREQPSKHEPVLDFPEWSQNKDLNRTHFAFHSIDFIHQQNYLCHQCVPLVLSLRCLHTLK